VRVRFDLSLVNLTTDGQRVLAMLRTRRYRVQRFELEAPAQCHLWVRMKP
jgi:Ni/Co efflux regulator RcnB